MDPWWTQTGRDHQLAIDITGMGDATFKSGTHFPAAESSEPPLMLEVLGEHLYAKVTELQEAYGIKLDIARLTGILLELGEKQVLKLLQDEELLQQAVKRVLHHVPGVASPLSQYSLRKEEAWREEDTDLKEHLYDQVYQLEPELAAQITGMLLELPAAQVNSLLQARWQLSQAVSHAKAARLSRHHPSHQLNSPEETARPDLSDSRGQWRRTAKGGQAVGRLQGECSCAEEKEGGVVEEGEAADEIGERVYAEAERFYPSCAAKLTGMVLDMGQDRVKALLQDVSQLHKVLEVAFSFLASTQQYS